MTKKRCLAIGGEPATGKTTLMKELIKNLSKPQNLRVGLVSGHVSIPENVAVMGIYDGKGKFDGTDRLSMAVNKDFITYVDMEKRNIMFEGDRLFSANNLIHISSRYHLRIIVLEQDEETLHKRHLDRGDTQTEKFLKGRKTKINNILSEFSGKCEVFRLNEISDTVSLSNELWQWLTADTD